MRTAATDERAVRPLGTAVVVDGVRRGARSAASVAESLGLQIVGEGVWYWAAPALVERHRPDLLVLGCDDPDVCLRVMAQVQSTGNATRVVVVPRSGRERDHRRLLEAGALVILTSGPREQPQGDAARLTPREREICALLTTGLSNREIAKRLWVTERTIKFHLSNVYKKLGVRTRTEAIAALRQTERGD